MKNGIKVILVLVVMLILAVISNQQASKDDSKAPQATVAVRPDAAEVKQRQAMQAAEQRRQAAYLKTPAGRVCSQHIGWSSDICEAVAHKQVKIGMTKEQVLASWGQPEAVRKTAFPEGTVEQWGYGVFDDLLIFNGGGFLAVVQSTR